MSRARENADLPVAMTEVDGHVGIINTAPGNYLEGELTVGNSTKDQYVNIVTGAANAAGLCFQDTTGTSIVGGLRYTHSDNNLAMWTNGSSRMVVDGSGRVTMPNQPMFSVTRPTAGTALHGDIFSGQTPTQDFTMQGFTFNSSNGRFTCPIGGKYLVSFYSISQGAEGYVQIRKNDNAQFHAYSQSGTAKWRTYSALGIISLAANDYLTFFAAATAANHNFHGQQHMRAVAYLIG